MIISIWRYSHLTLAVSSFIFILVAAISGIILAFEPISQKMEPYQIDGIEELYLNETLQTFKTIYPEVILLEIDANQFLIASVITEEGEALVGCFNPNNGEYLGNKIEKSAFFQFFTNLHRSLFLQSVGRFFVGLSSLLLLLISLSGTVLIIKRQLGIRNLFSKVTYEYFAQYYHIVLGRLFLVIIILLSLTGLYLSLMRFNVITLPEEKHEINFETLTDSPQLSVDQFESLKNIKLIDVKSIEFPFSDFIEDYYTIKLKNKELIINQFNGEMISEINYSSVAFFNDLSLDLHTGRKSILWSLIIGTSCISILFFIYSGFTITLKRRSNRLKNKYKKDQCKYIILVGSENGNTNLFANLFFKSLINAGEKVFIAELNYFSLYKKAEQIIVFTATYGEGEAPTNANKFLKTLQNTVQKPINYAVVGFGSISYPEFCQFAMDVDEAMSKKGFIRTTVLSKINDRSVDVFSDWLEVWKKQTGLDLELNLNEDQLIPTNTKTFEVVHKKEINEHSDSTFLIKLKTKQKFTSGDLLAIYPECNHVERIYSIGKVNGNIQLSIKLHEKGKGSNFLNDLHLNQKIKAKVITNTNFHFPKHRDSIIFICNGTGIAPFLGMIDENRKKNKVFLYGGFQTQTSTNIYGNCLKQNLENGKLQAVKFAYSREKQKQYVQDLIHTDSRFIADCLAKEGCIMICGSLAMHKDVMTKLNNITTSINNKSLDFYIDRNQILADCY